MRCVTPPHAVLQMCLRMVAFRGFQMWHRIEQHRAKHVEKMDAFNEVQARFYAIGADIARLEQSIHHAQERNRQLQVEFERVHTELQQTQTHLKGDKQKADNWRVELAEMEPQLSMLSAAEKEATAALQAAEEAMQSWHQELPAIIARGAVMPLLLPLRRGA